MVLDVSSSISEHCGEITVTGSSVVCSSGTPIYGWALQETGEVQSTRIASFNVDRAGTYHLHYAVTCSADTCVFGYMDTFIVVPLIPRFQISIDCRDITIINESSWLSTITPSHVWNLGIAGSSIVPAPSYTLTGYSVGGDYTVNYILSDGGTIICEDSETITIPQQLPIADFSFPDNRCEDISIPFTDLSIGDIRNWFWSFDIGASVDGIQNPDRVFPNDNGGIPRRIILAVTDEVGCTDDVFYDLTIRPNNLTGVLDPDNSILCDGDAVTLGYIPAFLSSIPVSYQWSNSITTDTCNVNNTGAYLLTVTDNFGCINNDMDKALVEVVHGSPAVIDGEAIYCVGEDISLHSVNTATSYAWKELPVTPRGSTRDITITGAALGMHTYQLTTTELGCTSVGIFTVNVIANPVLDALTYEVINCSPYEAVITGGPVFTGGSLLWSNGSGGTPITVYSPGYYEETFTYSGSGCQDKVHITLPDPPTALEFPEGCMRICDTLLPLTVPMSRSYDDWELYHDATLTASGSGVPTFVITSAGSYHMYLTIDGCSITTGDLDVEVLACTPCQCKLDTMRIDTLHLTGQDSCKYKFWNRSTPNHCYVIDSTVWGEKFIGRMGKGDSITYRFPTNGLYKVVATMYLRNPLTGQTCIIRDTTPVYMRRCDSCICGGTPHFRYTNYLSNNICCVLIEDITVYKPCSQPYRWRWRIGTGTPWITTVPYTNMCDSSSPYSLSISVLFTAENTYTEIHDSCLISKTDFASINPCNSGSLRRGEVMDGELSLKNGLAAYPIPFRDILNVTLYDEEQEANQIFTMIKIYDMLGKIVYLENKVFTDEVQTIDLSIISDGIYEMQVVDDKGNHYRVKLVKGGN